MKNLFCLLLLAYLGPVFGQEVRGYLLDSDGRAIEGGYIYNTVRNTHTHTNELGYFKIDGIHLGDTLRIGGLGFQKIEEVITKEVIEKILKFSLADEPVHLSEVVVRPKVSSLNVIGAIDLNIAPVKSSQEILQKVPGLFIGQHAGGGKAEQLFLRGFDLDHGTDIAISVDGLPVNMVSHAHGQGYADLHFLIPETLDKIDFGKGPYYASKGNFSTAAYVNFETRKSLKKNQITSEIGSFGWNRNLIMFDFLNNQNNQAYLAAEHTLFDGPFESPQHFSRLNIFGKYTTFSKNGDQLSTSLSHFESSWNASGQIPQRAVDQGIISRFGALDDSEGGQTSRDNLNLAFMKVLDDQSFIKGNAFYTAYKFLLYSDFTFFLEDPINGDQIKQQEARSLYGLNLELTKNLSMEASDLLLHIGAGLRKDDIDDDELSHTQNRGTILNTIQLGNVEESNVFGYVNAEITSGKFTVVPGVRVDHFEFAYYDALQGEPFMQRVKAAKVSPKLSILYTENNSVQYFFKTGIGFHSNDTRVVTAQQGKDILPAAYGADIGVICRATPKLVLNAAAWYLYLQQEFVYVGDAGIVEPSGETQRYGADLGVRYQAFPKVFFDTDLTYTVARSITAPTGQDYIPLAPDFTATGGLSFADLGKFSGGMRLRYLDSRPANEDGSILAEGYFLTDINLRYRITDHFEMHLSVENLFDTAWNETQFATESRLQNELTAVEEIHFTPGTPFFLKSGIDFKF